jgi:hypothetical protein
VRGSGGGGLVGTAAACTAVEGWRSGAGAGTAADWSVAAAGGYGCVDPRLAALGPARHCGFANGVGRVWSEATGLRARVPRLPGTSISTRRYRGAAEIERLRPTRRGHAEYTCLAVYIVHS